MRPSLAFPPASPWLGMLVATGFVGIFTVDVIRPEYQHCALYLVPVFVALLWKGRAVMLAAGGIAIILTFLAVWLNPLPVEVLSVVLYNRVAMSIVLGAAVLFAWWKEVHQAKAEFLGDRLAAIAEATNDAIWDYDLVKDELWWTPGHQMLFGVLPSTSIEGWYERIHPEDRERVVKGFRGAIEGSAQDWRDGYRYRRSDGSYADVLDRGEIRRRPDGEAIRMVGGMRDITTLKQAFHALQCTHEELKALSQKYRVLIDQVMTGVALIQHGRFVFVNPRSCTILQRSEEALLALPSIFEIVFPEDRALVEQRIQSRLAGVEASASYEARVVRPDGSLRWVEVYGSRIDFEGAPAILGVANDVTDRLMAQDRQQRLLDELVAARERLQALSQQLMHLQEEERKQIAQDLHDEIGQALTLVRADITDVRRTVGKSDAGLSGRLDAGLTTTNSLIERVRGMSLDLRPAMLDDLGLPETIRWYVDRIASRAGWTVEVLVDDALEDLAKPVALATFRIIQESLTNVMRHAAATRVLIKGDLQDGTMHLLIRDNGKGFDVERALKRVSQGGSVGLFSMQERLRILGGEVSVRSTPGTETIVQIQIPLEVAV